MAWFVPAATSSPGSLRRPAGVRGLALAPALLLAALPALTGCSTGTAPDPGGLAPLTSLPAGSASSAPSGASGSPSASGPSGSAASSDEEQIREVYATFMDARNVSLSDPRKPPDRRLWQVSIPPARDGVYSLVLHYRARELRVEGTPVSVISGLLVNGEKAEFQDCLDSRRVNIVIRKTGESALTPGQTRIVPVNVELVGGTGHWRVKSWIPNRGAQC